MPDEPHGPVGPGLVDAIAERMMDANRAATIHRAEVTQGWVNGWLEAHEADLAEFSRGVLAHLADRDGIPDHVRAALGTMLEPEHQAQFFIALFAVHGIIAQFVAAAVQPEVQAISNTAWSHDPNVPLTPSEAALAVLKGAITMDEGVKAARESGMDLGPFGVLHKITGEPPALQELLLLYRRGKIDSGRLAQGVRQSRIRDEWMPEVLELRYSPPSPAEVISAVVEGHLPLAEGLTKFQEAGINPENYSWMVQTAGRPPGIQQMLTLLNRGKATEEQVADAIRESNVKNKYIPALMELRYRIPPQRTVVSMLHHGVISDAQATEWLLDLGYHPEAVHIFIQEGHATKMADEKALAVGAVKSLYLDRLIPEDDAMARLHSLGYAPQEAGLILQLVDVARARRFLTAAVTRVHTLFVGYHLTETETVTTLDRLGVDPQERGDLMEIWKLERGANRRHLTLAQLQGAAKRGVIERPEFERRAAQLGYGESDMTVLWDESFAPSMFPGGHP